MPPDESGCRGFQGSTPGPIQVDSFPVLRKLLEGLAYRESLRRLPRGLLLNPAHPVGSLSAGRRNGRAQREHPALGTHDGRSEEQPSLFDYCRPGLIKGGLF